MTVVVTNLSKVMGIFSDILTKSRFEQQPVKGNFIPRPDPENNTTKGEKPVALAKESPRPVPGISEPHPDPKRRGKPKGRKAGGTFESDASVPDDSTYIVGMQKERLGRQISRTKRARKKHQRDMGQKEMAEGSPGRQLKPGERVLPRERPPILEELRESGRSERSNAMGVLHPQGKDAVRRKRRQQIKADSDFEAALGGGWSAPRTKREILMPKRGETREYSTGNHPEWERTKAPRQTPASKTETTPTGTGGRSYRYRDAGKRGVAGEVSAQAFGSDGVASPRRSRRSIDWKRGSDKYKNIDRETINPNKMMKAEGTSGERGWKAIRSGRLSSKYRPHRKEKMPYRGFGKTGYGTQGHRLDIPRDKAKNVGARLGETRRRDRATIRKPETFESMQKSDAREAARYQARKPKQSVMEQRKPAKIEPKDPNKPKEGQWKSGKWQELLKARKNNIYAIATDAAEGDEDKKEEIVQALKRDYKKLLKAFGVPISMPGGRQRILPIAPNSEGGYFTKETWGRHSLHPVARRPKTVTEKERGSHADGGEEYSSGARGGTPAILGMEKAKEYVQRELPFSTEDRDHIAPVPDPHADTLPEPTRRGGSKQGSRRKGEIPKGGWKEAALLWPAQPEDNGKGRKVKTRVGDTTGGYPT